MARYARFLRSWFKVQSFWSRPPPAQNAKLQIVLETFKPGTESNLELGTRNLELKIFHLLDTRDLHLFKTPAILQRRLRVDAEAGSDTGFKAGRIQRRTRNPWNDDRILIGLKSCRHGPVHL